MFRRKFKLKVLGTYIIAVGDFTRKSKSKKKTKGSSYNLTKKLNRLKSFYKRLYSRSKLSKERNPKNKQYFFEKYPTFESFLEKQTLKIQKEV
ncbi:MAG: hypothetical protein DRO67_06870 [Candidatus Asgardarchaeum californiense]|nr:MAG: hypothetical protein DRO67_06870 [Candidatus Asgardarchaeum californiense]